MLEHIFRNINDIRIFDLMVDFVIDKEKQEDVDKIPDESIEDDVVDIDVIMDMLDYREYKRLEVEDSVDHLVRQKVLGIRKIKVEGSTGCKICMYADKLKIPRIGSHKSHVSEQTSIGYVDNYYMKTNAITNGLRSAAFSHIFLTLDNELKENENKDKNEDDNKIKEINNEQTTT